MSRSDLFTVKEILLSDSMGPAEIPELSRLKGHNIFAVRLDRLETKLNSKYPALSDLRVVRRFPDQIVVNAVRREPFARAVLNGRQLLIDREGYFLGTAYAEQAALPLVKGMRSARTSSGSRINDDRYAVASSIITAFRSNRSLESLPLRSIDIADTLHIVCEAGEGEEEEIEVIVDAKSFTPRLAELGVLVSRQEVDLSGVKYVDLRFGAPIIAQKKHNGP